MKKLFSLCVLLIPFYCSATETYESPSPGQLLGRSIFSGRGGGASGDLISNIGNLFIDFDAAKGIETSGGAVTRWEDQSPTAAIATQTSSGNRPTYDSSNPYFNGFPTVDFSSTSTQWIGIQGSTQTIFSYVNGEDKPMTIFAVMRKPKKVVATESIVSIGSSTTASFDFYDFQMIYANSNSQRQYVRMRSSTATAQDTMQGLDDTISFYPVVLIYEFSGQESSGTVMGQSFNPTYDATVQNYTTNDYSAQGSFSMNRFCIGALCRSTTQTQPAEMELARLIGYSRLLTSSEKADVAAFLFNKYINKNPDISDFQGLVHNWDADNLIDGYGAPVSTFTDAVSGVNFTISGTSRPTVALSPTGKKVLRFDGVDDYMTAGSVSSFNILHDTSPVSVFIVYRTVTDDRASLEPLLDSVNNAFATNTGLGLYHYNVGGGSHTFKYMVGATNATAVINQPSDQARITPNEWHIASFSYENEIPSSEENFKFWLDNECFVVQDRGLTPATGNASNVLTLGKLSNTATFARVEIAQILVFNRAVGWRYETNLINKALALKWGAGITSVVGGNGLAGENDDVTKHRGFPATAFDSNGNMRIVYRRGTTHGSSAGSVIENTSSDGIDWSESETVIQTGEIAPGIGDYRVGSGYIKTDTGRLIYATEISSSNSALVPGTVYAYYSDDGSNWTSVHINPEQSGFDLNGSAAGLIQTQTGKIILTFAAARPGEGSGDQDIYITTSTDNGTTWGTPYVLIDRDDIAFRATETSFVQYEDGMLLMTLRDDTNHVIYKATSTNDGVLWSTGGLVNMFSGWGWPNIKLDENERLWCFYRSEALTNVAAYRYSDDRGVTWSNEFRLTNLNDQNVSSIEFNYSQMTYTDVTKDSSGNMWLAFGLEYGSDSDIFAKKFHSVAPTSTATVNGISNVIRWYSSNGLSESYEDNDSVTSVIDFSATGDNTVAINEATFQDELSNVNSVIQFDGVNDYYTFTEASESAWTIFFSVDGSALGDVLAHNVNDSILYVDPSFGAAVLYTTSGNYTWAFSALSDYDVVAINSDGEIWINGTAGTSVTPPLTTSLVTNRLGGTPTGGAFFSGNLGDVIIADSVLGTANMNTIGSYLAGRWGKTWSTVE